jgi:hypothetical protein
VADVLKRADGFRGPLMLMVADREKTAWIEIGPDQVSVKSVTNGVLYHTNHYVAASLKTANQKIGKSSEARYLRIGELLTHAGQPLTMADFIQYSNDQANVNPDYCIKRTGIIPKTEKTLATLIVKLPRQGSPVIYLELNNPGHPSVNYTINAADVFSGEAKTAYHVPNPQ